MKTKLLTTTIALLLGVGTWQNVHAVDLPLDTPTEDFTDNNDGTVTHKKTGLSWQRCSVGQTWNSTTSTCDGTASTMNWDDAMKNYSTDCNGWRLPRIDELNSIAEYGRVTPAINSTIFPNAPADKVFWSASLAALSEYARWAFPDYPDYVWIVDFRYGGNDNYVNKSDSNAVHLVRGGQFCSFDGSFTPTSDFTDNNDGTVTHNKTGLIWQHCSVGQTWTGTTCEGSPTMMNHDAATKQISTLADKSDWRLPTLKELKTLVEYKNYKPAINFSVFPDVNSTEPLDQFWSATVSAYKSELAWIVHFSGGYDSVYTRSNNNAVRLVRGGQPASIVVKEPVDLSAALSGNPTVKINQNITYTATANNLSKVSANNVILTLHLPPRVVKISSAPENCEIRPLSVVCSEGTLAPNASVSREINLSFNRAGGASLSSSVRTGDIDSNKTNNKARVITAIKK